MVTYVYISLHGAIVGPLETLSYQFGFFVAKKPTFGDLKKVKIFIFMQYLAIFFSNFISFSVLRLAFCGLD